MLELVRDHFLLAFALAFVAIVAIVTLGDVIQAFARRPRPVLCNCQCNKKHQKENE